MKDVEMQSVVSEHLDSVGYDEESKTMTIDFTDGSTYEYRGVTKDAFDNLVDASSVGDHFRRYFKGKYAYTKV
jgi:hypothetical protein